MTSGKKKILFALIVFGGTILLLLAAALWGVNGLLVHSGGGLLG